MHGTLPMARAAADDDAACRLAIRHGSKSFHAASLLLPRAVRRSALALYAFCRVSDDLVDGQDGATAPRAGATDLLLERLERAYEGRPHDHHADRAFAAAVVRHAIPRELPEALIEGFRWDEAGRTYETVGDLHDYGARVAASVGAMMTLAMGVRDPVALARACDLGLAMQLTNIARDVGEDARNGRLYLPAAWMREAGLDPDAFLADPSHCDGLGSVVARVLAEARRLYARSATGIVALPPACRTAIAAALSIYRDIGREIERGGHDSVGRRAFTTRNRKIALAAAASGSRFGFRPIDPAPPMPQVRFLVEAVERTPVDLPPAPERRMARVLALLGSMDARTGVALAERRRGPDGRPRG